MHLFLDFLAKIFQYLLFYSFPIFYFQLQRGNDSRRWFIQDNPELSGYSGHETGDHRIYGRSVDHYSFDFQHVIGPAHYFIANSRLPTGARLSEYLEDVSHGFPKQHQELVGEFWTPG